MNIEDYAFTAGNNVSLEISNLRPKELEIEEVVATVNNRERTYPVSENITPGEQDVTSLPAFEESESCEEVELEVVYSIGSLDGLTTTGEVVGRFNFNNQSLPQPLDAVNVNY